MAVIRIRPNLTYELRSLAAVRVFARVTESLDGGGWGMGSKIIRRFNTDGRFCVSGFGGTDGLRLSSDFEKSPPRDSELVARAGRFSSRNPGFGDVRRP